MFDENWSAEISSSRRHGAGFKIRHHLDGRRIEQVLLPIEGNVHYDPEAGDDISIWKGATMQVSRRMPFANGSGEGWLHSYFTAATGTAIEDR